LEIVIMVTPWVWRAVLSVVGGHHAPLRIACQEQCSRLLPLLSYWGMMGR
jgi:hypothetical protein